MNIPAYPLFEVFDREIAFGARKEKYYAGHLSWDEAKQAVYDLRHSDELRPYCDMANKFFCLGARLSDMGLKWKNGTDHNKCARALRALLCSFGVSHEQKEVSVALALYNWTDKIST